MQDPSPGGAVFVWIPTDRPWATGESRHPSDSDPSLHEAESEFHSGVSLIPANQVSYESALEKGVADQVFHE